MPLVISRFLSLIAPEANTENSIWNARRFDAKSCKASDDHISEQMLDMTRDEALEQSTALQLS